MVVSGGETESLLVVPEIRLAYTAVSRLATGDTPEPACVFVAGPPGSGKSHLASVFVDEIGRSGGRTTCRAVLASELAAGLAEASQQKTIDEFRQGFSQLQTLVCEDVQALAGRKENQLLLLSLIDGVLGRGGRVLLTASRLPGRLEKFDNRLVSRCRSGVVASIRMPGPASRLQLLEHFAARRQLTLPDEAAQVIAQKITGSPRELLAALGQLEILARISGTRMDAGLASRVVGGNLNQEPPSLAVITRVVARRFGVEVKRLKDGGRAQHVVTPRQVAMLLGRDVLAATYSDIAAFFGCSNHTTPLHACRRIRERLAVEPDLDQIVHEIHAELTGREHQERE